MSDLSTRRTQAGQKLQLLREKLGSAESILGDKACVYATGSYGRLEAGSQSDLDLFIVTKVNEEAGEPTSNQLSNLDTILVKADLIKATKLLQLPDFDADGKYLSSHSIHDFKKHLGGAQDDYRNTLTGRLLLFLESQPLVGEAAYNDIIEDVIAAYFIDFADHSDNFIPAFLANDILRLWRTFCVNYEYGRKKTPADKLKNYKLKHSRMLTCYSALIYLLATYTEKGTVLVADAKAMTKLTPTERLEAILSNPRFEVVHDKVSQILDKYFEFLCLTDRPKGDLIKEISSSGREWNMKSYAFGDLMHDVLKGIGQDSRFYRLLVV
ncbi:nucleotidyltransferase domain-containing protein [Cereibacter sphaeroides]|uniref:nucleotidyltransferase domain-containing protein n=1 Tax=Cereibacter sphaeroides TaxID=1063 RepID=UPI001F1C8746|nr:nucleotidyltransferase domain-containing protein [Cereibacter sphaeroides]MCE6949485.1 nucleotidyltransferase domain-containing protein [Cereibacter sphaeroides]